MNESDSLLIDAYLDGNLPPEQGEELQHLLRNDPEARSTLRRRATIDEALTDLAAAVEARNKIDEEPGSVATVARRWAAEPHALASVATDAKRSRIRTLLPWGITFVLGLVLLSNWFTSHDPEQVREPDPIAFLGLLVDEAGAEFESGFGPDDVRFDDGEYRLQSGAIQLRLENGADLVMRSPARFRLDDSFHLELLDGGLRAVVPPSAKGLTIAAPQVHYEDLGTEFGVSVDRESGASRVHVFNGEVNAREANSNRLLSALTSGQSMQFADDEWTPVASPASDEFLAPGQIGFLRWQRWREEFTKDESLIAFYSFARNPDSPTGLANEAGRASEGRINGARWVTGRWPGKDALLFDRDDDSVDLTIPGEYDEITLSFWCKIDRFDYEHSALLNSAAWDEGDLHFQVGRTGRTLANLKGKKSSKPRFEGEPVEPNRWQHIVCVVSRTDETSRTFINGKLAWDQRMRLKGPIAPGKCSLGNWLDIPEQYQPTRRAFKGRMDEVAIWNRVLSDREIKAHYEAGRPNLLAD